MIVLDTNVLSELMRPEPSSSVQRWLSRMESETLATTVITVAEIETGIARLPEGARRDTFLRHFEMLMGPELGFNVLPLDEPAARLAGHLRHRRESQGLGAQFADMMIAAIAARFGASIATRNTADFIRIGLEVVDPFV